MVKLGKTETPLLNYQFQKKQQKASVVMPLPLEETLAAQTLGIPLELYHALPGTREWIDEDAPIPLSKSCVIAQYRLRNLAEAVQHDIAMSD